MTFVVCWFIFPLLLVAMTVGCGLLVERIADARVPGPLLPAVGLAVFAVVGQLTTLTDATAELTAPLLLSLAIAGFMISWPLRDRRLDGWAIGAAVGAYAVYGAPVLLSGEATFGGYIRLDDTASWLAIAERVLHEGANVSGLAPSTHEATLDFYLNSDYPVGALVPLGVGGELLGQDYAWVWQPYLSLMGAMLALALYAATAQLGMSTRLRAGVAFVAAQPALLVGYVLWGGFKEVEAALLVVAVAVLSADAALRRPAGRQLVPLAVVSAAVLAVLSSGGGVWVLPFLLPVAVVWLRADRAAARSRILQLGAMVTALAIPAILAVGFLGAPAASTITEGDRLANLIEPLSLLQILGIWPAGDFRLRPAELAPTHVLIAVAGVAAILGFVWMWRSRHWTLLLYSAGVLGACAVVVILGSHWVDAKALAIASPAVLLAALLGTVVVYRGGRHAEAVVLAAAITGGVIWSNALAYHTANLAPRERHAELEEIGERFAGRGPALMTEYEPYGARYFLRDTDPESAGELRRRHVRLRDGTTVRKGGYADLDDFQLGEILTYRLLVLRRSPVASRPPAVYRLAWQGDHYEVWERPELTAQAVVDHIPLGSELQPAATAGCEAVRLLAERATGGAELAAMPRPQVEVVDLGSASRPASWLDDERRAGAIAVQEEGTANAEVAVSKPGTYEVWLGGVVRGEVELAVDGRRVGAVRHSLSNTGQYTPVGTISLRAGTHQIELTNHAGDLHPGSGGRRPESLGPVVLSPVGLKRDPVFVSPGDARRLCGRSLDWIELLGR